MDKSIEQKAENRFPYIEGDSMHGRHSIFTRRNGYCIGYKDAESDFKVQIANLEARISDLQSILAGNPSYENMLILEAENKEQESDIKHCVKICNELREERDSVTAQNKDLREACLSITNYLPNIAAEFRLLGMGTYYSNCKELINQAEQALKEDKYG